MSADASVARAIKAVRALQSERSSFADEDVWLAAHIGAVADLIAEAKDALHLTNDDINRY